MTPRWALFISGRGSTAQAVMDLFDQIDIRLVVSSKKSAVGLLRAHRMGIPTAILPKQIDWDEVDLMLRSRRIERIFLLGFMRIVPESFLTRWQGRIWNVHPSLLPQFPGAHAIRDALLAGADLGVTVHDVIPEMDAGPVRRQKWISTAAEHDEVHFSIHEQSVVRGWAAMMNLTKSTALLCEAGEQ